jgi:transposase
MGNVTTIGVDIAKNVFQVHGVDADGAAVVRQPLTRGRMLKFFAKLPRCLLVSKPAQHRTSGHVSWSRSGMT